ncbi:recombinase family protein [Mycobacterium sp. URHB0021]
MTRANGQLDGGARAPLFLAYTRVSTEEQANSGLGLEAQRHAIDTEADRRGWVVEHFSDEGVSGKIIGPQLREVLGMLGSGQANGLVVAKLDRLSRSIINAADIIQRANDQGWSLVLLDINLDLTTAAGRMIAHNLMNFAQYERELISERTKAALAAKKARREPLGRKPLVEPAVVRRIVKGRNSGDTYAAIAAELVADGILSPAGHTKWETSTVRRIFDRANGAKETA